MFLVSMYRNSGQRDLPNVLLGTFLGNEFGNVTGCYFFRYVTSTAFVERYSNVCYLHMYAGYYFTCYLVIYV